MPSDRITCDWFLTNIIPERDYAKATVDMYNTRIKQLRASFENTLIEEVSVKNLSDFLETFSARSSLQIRQVATDIFKVAISRGLRPVGDNPAEATLKRKYKKTRKRLSLEEYKRIRFHAPAWMKNAMDLALLTLQRREDISKMKFEDITCM
ncbi:hypothetical protein ONV78_07085 [Hahella sp. CR1]|uniref:hypothetical protein n=1 Tax=Hahella sp. CR1 TaxID=2992807 RepID=UPI002441FB94|nr:hypothetical protein [Hahella sp. CR1]MDG9667494.1 hypothetical protein [Hahella sp. CR1]